MKVRRLSPKVLIGLLIALFFGIALFIRVYFPYDQVFSGDWIRYTGVDAYYHMRVVDNLVHNFPQLFSFDPYRIYPGGSEIAAGRFFDRLLASIIWVIGLGSPSRHTVDVIGVYFPAVLAALIVIPVYFIGKELFNRWAGVLSAGLIAILPGEFMGRSILGFTDHHVAETLFATVTMLFLILAVKAARQRQLTFSHLYQCDWAAIKKPVIYSLLTGIFLGIYFLTWSGALLFAFIISVYFIFQFVVDHWRHQSTDYLCIVGVLLFLIALVMFLPGFTGMLYLASLIIALLAPAFLSIVSRWMTNKGIKPVYYPLTLFGFGLAGLVLFYVIEPNLFLRIYHVFWPTEVSRTTMEMQPLLFPQGNFTLKLAWGNFTTGFFLSVGLLLCILLYWIFRFLLYLIIGKRIHEIRVFGKRVFPIFDSSEKTILVVWSLVILTATLGQRRFAYYFAVNAALLTGYLSWQFLRLAGFRELLAKPVEVSERLKWERAKFKPKKDQKVGFRLTTRHINMALAVIIVFFLVIFPNIGPAITTAKQAPFGPSDAWYSSLTWLKENSPEPFGDPSFYYQRYEPPPPGESYNYPESVYGVLAWWDYGYWITRIAHRLPNTNPGQPPVPITNTARFFLSQDEDSTQEIIKVFDSSYIIIDYQTATSKLWAIIKWAGMDRAQFFEVYYTPYENRLQPVTLFHPEYYRSLAVRLYNFDGQAVTPQESIVISYEERMSQEDKPFKLITDAQTFPTYEEATAYISSQESTNYRIVNHNPFISPVPLEALKHYRLIYSSTSGVEQQDVGLVPEVKIFEYIGD